MSTASPYATPKAEIETEQKEYGSINILSSKGRIGRLRYIAYTIGITLACYFFILAFSGLFAAFMAEETLVLMVVPIVAIGIFTMFFINILLTIQRCHDFNMSGWLSLIMLIPLVPLIFWFIPGTDGVNRFGSPPPPNKGMALILVMILIMVLVLGIVAAIAIPAYQDYLARAAAARM